MRAVVIHETGGVDVLRLEEVERPVPGEGEVLVRVQAASVNPIDWKLRRGLMPKRLPAILGSDASGVVEVSNAEGFGEGEEVFGFLGSGSYAEFGTAVPATLAHKPDHLTHEQAAALPVAALTAWQALFERGGLERGQKVLITGASGGVGHLAVQLAAEAGAEVLGTGSPRSREFVLGLGAERFIDYTSEDLATAASDVDLVFDAVGHDTQKLLQVIRPGGRMVVIASAPPEGAAERDVDAQLLVMSPDSARLEHLAQLVADEVIRVEIDQVMPLADVQRAHALSESGHARGKIVLTV
ncbi:MAG TPA: NADP-dependent oxidoreductase [Solirubrobacteraceae bacterium]|nr:NADP-dependent oxidoreductase [Solirubrobacteraceae bacterium]